MKNNLSIPEKYKEDLFHWVVNQRLEKFPSMPIEGSFPLSSAGGDDINYQNEVEYIELIQQLENQFPEFKYEKKVLEYVGLVGVNHPYQASFKKL